jgi:hypothetical protein
MWPRLQPRVIKKPPNEASDNALRADGSSDRIRGNCRGPSKYNPLASGSPWWVK